MTDISDESAPPPPPVAPDAPPGPWPERRRLPHFGELLGAVGGLLAIFGLVTLLSEMVDSGSGAAVAALVAAGVVVAAYVGLTLRSTGPEASALVVITLLGAAVPMPLIVAAQDNPGPKGAATMVLLVPTIAWAASFFAGPARGRLPYLGAALLGLWLLVGVQVVDTGGGAEFGSAATTVTASTSDSIAVGGIDTDNTATAVGQPVVREVSAAQFGDDEFDGDEGPTFFEQLSPFAFFFGTTPDSLGVLSLLFGVGYLAAAVALERRGARGGATPFVAVGNLILVLSISLLSGMLEQVGTSVYALLVGGSLCWFGSASRRRFTAWLGALFLAGGVGGLVTTITDDIVPGGLLLLLGGALTVVAATQIKGPEPDEDDASVV